MTQVYITGFSALTSSGTNAAETWESVLAGQTGISTISGWDLTSWKATLGGELKPYQPAKLLPDKKLIKVISKQDVLGIHTAVEAVKHSQMIEYRDSLKDPAEFNESTGVYVGSPGNKYFQQYDFLPLLAQTSDMKSFGEKLFDVVHPMWLLRILPNNVLAYTGITFNFKGANHNIVNHAAGGTQAIIEAYQAIKSGQIKRAVVVAYDIGIEPQALFYYDKLGVLSHNHLKPFDKNHNGTILADGAAAIVLESEESVRERNAVCHAQIMAGMATTEGESLFSLAKEGKQLGQLLEKCMTAAQIQPKDIDFVVAHANGNPHSDDSEAAAIQSAFNTHRPAVTGFKWSTGHTLCASGLIDTVLTTCSLKNKIIPGIASHEEIAENCSFLDVSPKSRNLKGQSHALLINRGFANIDACLVLKSCE